MNDEDLFLQNSDGNFILSVEDVPASDDWQRTTKYPGYEGDAAYVYTGPNTYGVNRNADTLDSTLSFQIDVEDPGNYFLGLSMGRTHDFNSELRGDEGNDVWVRVDDGPWTKVFASGMPWEEASSKFGATFDVNHQKSNAAYDLSAGIHTIEVAGRSTGLILDQIQLSQNRGEATSKGQPLSPVDSMPPSTPVEPPVVEPPIVDEPPVVEGGGDTDAPVDPNGLFAQADHVVFHFDGNNNDPDDIAALPVAALLAKAAGAEDKIDLYFGNNLAEPNNNTLLNNLRDSADFAESIGINTVDYQSNVQGATESLVDLINSGQQLLFIEGGPMEAVYRALEGSNPAMHDNVTLLSHSGWNENRSVVSRPGETQARTWSDIDQDFPLVTLVEIDDQNAGSNNTNGFNNRDWSWMDQSDDPVIQDARDAMKGAGGNKANDPSDAGMLLYALTGEENGKPADAKAYLESSTVFGDAPTPPAVDPDPAPIDPAPVDPAPVDPPSGDVALNFYLADVQTDEIIMALEPGAKIPASVLENRDVTVFAETADGSAAPGSVEISMNGATSLENITPYALFGDKNGDFLKGAAFASGDNAIDVSVFSGKNGTGSVLEQSTLSFEIVADDEVADEPTVPDAPVSGDADLLDLFLVDMETGQTLGEIRQGETLAVDNLTDRRVKIEARLEGDDAGLVESVALSLDGGKAVQNVAGYNFKAGGENWGNSKFSSGQHELEVAAYDQNGAKGELLHEEEFSITITEDGLIA